MATAMIVSSRGRPGIQTSNNTCPPDLNNNVVAVTSHPHTTSNTKVPLVYYLTRNGNLEHPHFMEVPLSSTQGRLYLRDVINRLVILRGRGMTDLYSWSCKRSYKNGFVWHDLEENDFVYPAQGQEYVLKGTELFHAQIISKSNDIIHTPPSTATTQRQPPMLIRNSGGSGSGDDSDFPMATRQRNQSWTSADFNQYKVYKSDIQTDSACGGGRAAANASTQTEDRRSRRRTTVAVVENEEDKTKPSCSSSSRSVSQSMEELRREDISPPPPSDSSPETLASLLKGDSRVIVCPGTKDVNPSGRLRASSVLMQLISCGSMSFKDCGPTCWKDEEEGEERQGFNLISYYKGRLPRGRDSNQQVGKKMIRMETSEKSGEVVKMEGKEYFSGSLIETKKDEIPILKRSASYSAADRYLESLMIFPAPRVAHKLGSIDDDWKMDAFQKTQDSVAVQIQIRDYFLGVITSIDSIK